MRGPLENLLTNVASRQGHGLVLHGEVHLSEVRARPDYAVRVGGAVVGHLEVKAPGKGADPRRYSDRHDRRQWERLQALPNIVYTDGNQWALFRSGEIIGDVVVLGGDVRLGPAGMRDPGSLWRLLSNFFAWEPPAPRSAHELAWSVAGLCRLLRDEVSANLETSETLRSLAQDWRALLFPDADDDYFADQFAQTVTFGLLLARSELIEVRGRLLSEIANDLGREHSLIGKALTVLTESLPSEVRYSLEALVRVVGAVEWSAIADPDGSLVINLYEVFLSVYDPVLRARTGSYYTPRPVVSAVTHLVDEVVRLDLGHSEGLAAPEVVIVDPAMGTGTFLLSIIELLVDRVRRAQGEGMVPGSLNAAIERLIGFEIQTGPFAVAEMRLFEELRRQGASIPDGGTRLYVADTLDDPHTNMAWLPTVYAPIAHSRLAANQVKLNERVMVVLGNPPFRNQARGDGGWVEQGHPGEPALFDDFLPEAADDVAPMYGISTTCTSTSGGGLATRCLNKCRRELAWSRSSRLLDGSVVTGSSACDGISSSRHSIYGSSTLRATPETEGRPRTSLIFKPPSAS